jgi:MtN3 and saliva related transmembrane protein
MELTALAGYAGAVLTTVAFIPQAVQTWRTRSTAGISLGMYAIFTTGVALWLAYGLMLGEWPIILANSITFPLALSILLMKMRYG